MSMVIDGKGMSLRKIMESGVAPKLTNAQRRELVRQLVDASVHSGNARRRAMYAEWAREASLLGNPATRVA